MGLFTIPIEMKNTITDQEIYDNAIVALERSKSSNISKISIYNNDLGKALSRDQIMEEDLRAASCLIIRRLKSWKLKMMNLKCSISHNLMLKQVKLLEWNH